MTVTDDLLRGLTRSGIWRLAWNVRGTGSNSRAGIRRAREVIRRWERLTGMKYYAGR